MRKTIIAAALAACMLGACTPNNIPTNTSTKEGTGSVTQKSDAVPAPDFDTASELAGFKVKFPAEILDMKGSEMTVTPGRRAELKYKSADDSHSVYIRKGKSGEDLTDDILESEFMTKEQNGVKITFKGAEDIVKSASWTSGEYTYAVISYSGMTMQEMLNIVGLVS